MRVDYRVFTLRGGANLCLGRGPVNLKAVGIVARALVRAFFRHQRATDYLMRVQVQVRRTDAHRLRLAVLPSVSHWSRSSLHRLLPALGRLLGS